jgi:hypothetical protein
MGEERFLREVDSYVPVGNSRDQPTRFLFFCPNRSLGCKYNSTNKVVLGKHVVTCNRSEETSPAPLPSALYKCRKEGCTVEPFDTTHKRDYHEKSHTWVRKQCDLGCTDGTWYESHHSWKTHLAGHHNENWDKDTTCSYPSCERSEPFNNYQDYFTHLRYTHTVNLDDMKQYFPEKRVEWWGKRKCPFPDCQRPEQEYGRPRELVDHFKAKTHVKKKPGHGITADEPRPRSRRCCRGYSITGAEIGAAYSIECC